MIERIAISGSHGFVGEYLTSKFNEESVLRMGRSGFIPPGIDVVFSLASFGNMYGQTDVHGIYRANLMRVMAEMDHVGVARYIYVSTSSVILPVQTAYSASKKAAEEFLKISDKKVATVRPFTVVGVGEQKEHLIPKLIDSCLYGTEMPFISEPVHDFLDVEDFVDALLIVKDKAQFKGEIYEVGTGTQTSNQEVRLLVEDITGNKANIRPVESMRSYDTTDWVSNNERIYSLGWEPKRNMRQTISEMVDYEKTRKSDIEV